MICQSFTQPRQTGRFTAPGERRSDVQEIAGLGLQDVTTLPSDLPVVHPAAANGAFHGARRAINSGKKRLQVVVICGTQVSQPISVPDGDVSARSFLATLFAALFWTPCLKRGRAAALARPIIDAR